MQSQRLQGKLLLANSSDVTTTMGHFNITVHRSNGLRCKRCIHNADTHRCCLTSYRIHIFINTGIYIRVAKRINTIELVVRMAIPEVSMIENGVDHQWCIAADDLSGVDSTCAINRVCNNASQINRGVGDTYKVTLEYALAANNVAELPWLCRHRIIDTCELGEREATRCRQLPIYCMAIVPELVTAWGELIIVTAIRTRLVVTGCAGSDAI